MTKICGVDLYEELRDERWCVRSMDRKRKREKESERGGMQTHTHNKREGGGNEGGRENREIILNRSS